ncbi:hypothetical protein J6590_013995 [Homalodisca vitripennis]|nr:hypothetical protein J6590_013995 [Homalodisca vitripennis]
MTYPLQNLELSCPEPDEQIGGVEKFPKLSENGRLRSVAYEGKHWRRKYNSFEPKVLTHVPKKSNKLRAKPRLKGALYHRPEIAVRCFKNPLGALAKSVVGRAMSSCCGRDRNLPSASDICRARDPSIWTTKHLLFGFAERKCVRLVTTHSRHVVWRSAKSEVEVVVKRYEFIVTERVRQHYFGDMKMYTESFHTTRSFIAWARNGGA